MAAPSATAARNASQCRAQRAPIRRPPCPAWRLARCPSHAEMPNPAGPTAGRHLISRPVRWISGDSLR